MTTVIAAKDMKGRVVFAWDTQVTSGVRPKNGVEKVFANGPVIFGVSGTVRTLNVLRYMDVPPRGKGDTRKWIVRALIPAIIKSLKDVDAVLMEDSQANTESHVIIAVDGVVGYLGSDLSFVEDEMGIYAVGSGSQFALGALAADASLGTAMDVAGALDIYTGTDHHVRTAKKIRKDAK